MPELLKFIYNDTFFRIYIEALKAEIINFNEDKFRDCFGTPHWDSLELKQRMSYLSHITQKLLPKDYEKKVEVIVKIIEQLRALGIKDQNLEYAFFPEIIVDCGLDNLKVSIKAMEKITQFVSFEFGVRPFIIKYPKEMMAQMLVWADHKNANVRRFASEGCRPRLPWGTQLKQLVKDPSPVFPILEKLKSDESLYVRKSVANNINDISKDHPEKIVDLIGLWKDFSPETNWIIKHGARSLLKSGNPHAMSIFGYDQNLEYKIDQFTIEDTEVSAQNPLFFSISLTNTSKMESNFRLEYNIWYQKSNGSLSKKIFKLTEKILSPEQSINILKKHEFKDLTTRIHHEGLHKISLVINGIESPSLSFFLKNAPDKIKTA